MKISAKGLIFDYGGTIDSNGYHWAEVIWNAYERANVPVSREQFRNAYVMTERYLGNNAIIKSDDTFYNVLHTKLNLQFENLNINDKKLADKIANDCYNATTQTITQAHRTLDVLDKKYPMILVSNFYGNIRKVLNEFKLTDYFKKIIESAEVGIRKPDPAIYQLGIDALGFPASEVVIIGDSYKNDIHPAELLGCQSIWLKNKGWDDKDDAIEHPCIIKDFTMLEEIL